MTNRPQFSSIYCACVRLQQVSKRALTLVSHPHYRARVRDPHWCFTLRGDSHGWTDARGPGCPYRVVFSTIWFPGFVCLSPMGDLCRIWPPQIQVPYHDPSTPSYPGTGSALKDCTPLAITATVVYLNFARLRTTPDISPKVTTGPR